MFYFVYGRGRRVLRDKTGVKNEKKKKRSNDKFVTAAPRHRHCLLMPRCVLSYIISKASHHANSTRIITRCQRAHISASIPSLIPPGPTPINNFFLNPRDSSGSRARKNYIFKRTNAYPTIRTCNDSGGVTLRVSIHTRIQGDAQRTGKSFSFNAIHRANIHVVGMIPRSAIDTISATSS